VTGVLVAMHETGVQQWCLAAGCQHRGALIEIVAARCELHGECSLQHWYNRETGELWAQSHLPAVFPIECWHRTGPECGLCKEPVRIETRLARQGWVAMR
jgi:hypothetical protein